MKRLLNKAIALALMAATWVGCVQEDYYLNTGQESESDIQVSLNLNIPDPVQVTTRSGVTEGIQDITVLCFDKDEKALLSTTVNVGGTGSKGLIQLTESGSLTVKIPNATRSMHLVANQSVSLDKGTDESVLKTLKAQSMVYWGRIEVPSDVTTSSAVKEWWAGKKSITLLRNMAKVKVVNNASDFYFVGFAVVNTNYEGYVVPYSENYFYPTTSVENEEFTLEDWDDYVHADKLEDKTVDSEIVNDYKETDQTFRTNDVYVYETLASTSACIIIKGCNIANAETEVAAEDEGDDSGEEEPQYKYWKVLFSLDGEKMLNIRRNHCYTVSIEGTILDGYDNFEDAVKGEANANSAWLSIAEEVTAVANNKYSLTIQNSSFVVVDGTESLDFRFWTQQLGSAEGTLEVSWEKGQNDALGDGGLSYRVEDASKGQYKVTVPLAELGEGISRREGKVVIKYGTGIQRKVKITIIPEQSFAPIDYDEMNPGADITAPIAKLNFTIPDTYPAEMFPFTVRLSTKDFTVRKVDDTQKDVSLLFPGDGGYGESNNVGYKFAYQVAAPGEHSLYLVNNGVVQDYGYVTLEADQFESIGVRVGLNRENQSSGTGDSNGGE